MNYEIEGKEINTFDMMVVMIKENENPETKRSQRKN